jgi:hypothetical protein
MTIPVDRDAIGTGNIGICPPMLTGMGPGTGTFRDTLCRGLFKAGFDTPCRDGQNVFAIDHPVHDADGLPVSLSDTGGGSGTGWSLVDASRALKPVILPTRRDVRFVAKDRLNDDTVFMNKTFVRDADARASVGFGLRRCACGSEQTLNAPAPPPPSSRETPARLARDDEGHRSALDRHRQIAPTTDLPGQGTEASWQQRVYSVPDGTRLVAQREPWPIPPAGRAAWPGEDEGRLPEPVRRERRAFVQIGPPASGKSAVANRVARYVGAAIADADEAKKIIPA